MRSPPRPLLVLGLGNPILGDDAVGLVVARGVAQRLRPGEAVEALEAEIAGFSLVDLLADRPATVIVDAWVTPEAAPGTVAELSLESFQPTRRLATMHQVDLPTAVALGREMGRNMPAALRVLAVAVRDANTFRQGLSPVVVAAVPQAVQRALALTRGFIAAGTWPR